MELRKYRVEDRGALARLAKTAFGEGGLAGYWESYYDPERNARLDPEQVHIIEEDGEARATATVLPMEVFVDGDPAPMGGVAAVTAHPAYRRRGYAGELMRAALRDMRGRGTHLSMLWPFSHAFYRVYGWELAGESISYTLKPTDLPTSPEQKHVRAYREEDLPRMAEIFEAGTRHYSLCVRRNEDRWRQFLGRKEQEAAVYEREGRVEGYAIYNMSDWSHESYPYRTLNVSELAGETREAWEAMISFMAAQDPLVFEIKYSTPRGEALHPYLRSSHVKAGIEPEFMLRLVDVEGALGFKALRGDPLVLEISDDVIPENAGEYTVGNGEVVRGAEAEEWVSLDVRRLAQLYAGYLPAHQLARHGLVKPSSPNALDLLEAHFPVGDPWVSAPDHF
ncbi:MAG TPA: GNAT family N-acetyltransferase [Rubrobacteraceae bacterium]|nr:GNAT family N-acetyltransferase [Rubrobacteraceae bacterium]